MIDAFCRKVNVSHWGAHNCRNGLSRQKSYIFLLEQSNRPATLKASQSHQSAAIEFSQESEENVLKGLGKFAFQQKKGGGGGNNDL